MRDRPRPRPADSVSLLACLRPRAWWYFALLPFAGITAATLTPAAAWEAALGMAHAATVLAFAYGLNAITDAGLDRSAAKNPLAGRSEVPRRVRAVVGGCAAIGVLLALARTGTAAVPAAFVVLSISFAYSAPPRLKSVPFIGTVLNAGIFTPLFWLGPRDVAVDPVLPVLFTGLLIQNQLLHEREDLEEDLAARVVTTAAVLGDRGTRGAVVAVGGAAIAALAQVSSGASLAVCVGGVALATTVVLRDKPGRGRHRKLAALAGSAAYLMTSWVTA